MIGQDLLAPVLTNLEQWVHAAAADAAWTLTMPSDKTPASATSISTYLLETMPAPTASTSRRPSIKWTLRFLVTAWAADPAAALSLLLNLALTASAQTTWQVEPTPPPAETWNAFNLVPRPSFVLRMPVELVQPTIAAPSAKSISINGDQILPLHGFLLGPGDVPLANGVIQVPALHLRTVTDYRGEFSLAGVPGTAQTTLHISARGASLDVICRAIDHVTSPLILRMSTLEA